MKGHKITELAWVKEGDCIRCTSHKLNGNGYPRLTRKKVTKTICRWILIKRYKSDLLDNEVSRHSCDNRWCINPAHISRGSRLDNMRDMISRGRAKHPKGQECHNIKLDAKKVDEIRKLAKAGMQRKDIAERFGISSSYASHIVLGRYWKSVSYK